MGMGFGPVQSSAMPGMFSFVMIHFIAPHDVILYTRRLTILRFTYWTTEKDLQSGSFRLGWGPGGRAHSAALATGPGGAKISYGV